MIYVSAKHVTVWLEGDATHIAGILYIGIFRNRVHEILGKVFACVTFREDHIALTHGDLHIRKARKDRPGLDIIRIVIRHADQPSGRETDRNTAPFHLDGELLDDIQRNSLLMKGVNRKQQIVYTAGGKSLRYSAYFLRIL